MVLETEQGHRPEDGAKDSDSMPTKWLLPVAILLIAVLIYLTRGILLPFIGGLAVAYFLDPFADMLENRKVPRGLAAGLVIFVFFALAIGVLVAFWPILQSQLGRIAAVIPEMLAVLRDFADQVLMDVHENFTDDLTSRAEGLLTGAAKEALSHLQSLVASIFESGLAIFNLLGLMTITPVVAFYLLRDWDLIVAELDSWLPDHYGPVVRQQMTKIDAVLGGFVRGQLGVCAIMGVLYGVGWTAIGLDFGLLLGLLAGLMGFIPFVGVLVAVGMAMLVGVGQWGFDLTNLGLTAGVFVFVQTLESVVLTPRLVGGQVGLHPVWVLFAVFAGGELMGFLGVLIAVPVAAVIAVLTRFALDEHKKFHRLKDETALSSETDNTKVS